MEFLLFLNKWVGKLMAQFSLFPISNAVKSDILKLNAKILKSSHPTFEFRPIELDVVRE